jgi:hypothetical protein
MKLFSARPLLLLFLFFLSLADSLAQQAEVEELKKPEQEQIPTVRKKRRANAEGKVGEEHKVFFSNFVLQTNEVASDVVVIGGDAQIDGHVTHTLTVIGGSAIINGSVSREAVIVAGGVTLGPEASVGRHSVFIGGPFKISPTAALNRDHVQIELGNLASGAEWFREWVAHGLLWGRLLTLKPLWPWTFAGAFFTLYALLVLLFPRAASSVVEALEKRPVASLCAGILQVILWAPLTLLLAVTVVGILAIPFFQIGMFLLILFGKAGLLCFIGKNIGRSLRMDSLGHPFFSLVIGAIVLALTYMVPVIGLIAFFVATPVAFGAGFIALTSSFKRTESRSPSPIAVALRPTTSALAVSLVPTTPGPIMTAADPAASGSTSTASISPPVLGDPAARPDIILMPRAGFWKRLAAAALDLLLLSLLLPFVQAFFIPIAIAYFIIMWTWKGTTIGSIALGLKIVRTDGRPINFAVALVRSLSSLFSATVLFLGFLWTAWDGEKQAWHDKIAGTVVVKTPKGMALV